MEKNQDTNNLHDVVNSFDVAMLVTHGADGIHARPMTVARLDENMSIYLMTDLNSVKVNEIHANPNAILTFQSSRKFASLSGKLDVVSDRPLIESMWKELWKVWFPKGKTDPSITLLKFTACKGEFWDNAGMQGLKFIYDATKALAAGERPEPDREQHAKVGL